MSEFPNPNPSQTEDQPDWIAQFDNIQPHPSALPIDAPAVTSPINEPAHVEEHSVPAVAQHEGGQTTDQTVERRELPDRVIKGLTAAKNQLGRIAGRIMPAKGQSSHTEIDAASESAETPVPTAAVATETDTDTPDTSLSATPETNAVTAEDLDKIDEILRVVDSLLTISPELVSIASLDQVQAYNEQFQQLDALGELSDEAFEAFRDQLGAVRIKALAELETLILERIKFLQEEEDQKVEATSPAGLAQPTLQEADTSEVVTPQVTEPAAPVAEHSAAHTTETDEGSPTDSGIIPSESPSRTRTEDPVTTAGLPLSLSDRPDISKLPDWLRDITDPGATEEEDIPPVTSADSTPAVPEKTDEEKLAQLKTKTEAALQLTPQIIAAAHEKNLAELANLKTQIEEVQAAVNDFENQTPEVKQALAEITAQQVPLIDILRMLNFLQNQLTESSTVAKPPEIENPVVPPVVPLDSETALPPEEAPLPFPDIPSESPSPETPPTKGKLGQLISAARKITAEKPPRSVQPEKPTVASTNSQYEQVKEAGRLRKLAEEEARANMPEEERRKHPLLRKPPGET